MGIAMVEKIERKRNGNIYHPLIDALAKSPLCHSLFLPHIDSCYSAGEIVVREVSETRFGHEVLEILT